MNPRSAGRSELIPVQNATKLVDVVTMLQNTEYYVSIRKPSRKRLSKDTYS